MADGLPEAGLFASLRRLCGNLIELTHTRLELVSVEIEAQIDYATGLLLWAIAAIFFASMTVLLLALVVVIAFWDGHRLLAAGLVTAAFALFALVAALVVRARLRQRPRFLSATAAELKLDGAALGRDLP